MKKKLYLVLKPKQTNWERTNDYIRDFTVEGIYQRPPANKAGLTIELELDIDLDMFRPIRPNASIKIEKDEQAEQAMTVVTGKRVKSPHAPPLV